MKPIIRGLLCFFLFFLLQKPILAQDFEDVSEVEQFWIGFIDQVVSSSNSTVNSISIVALENSEGYIEYAGDRVDFNLSPGEEFYYFQDLANAAVRTTQTIENKGIYIYAKGEVNVSALAVTDGSTEGTNILPISALGSDYVISSHWEPQTKGISLTERQRDNESLILLVGIADNTVVEFLANNLPGTGPLDPISVTLNRGETYQFRAKADFTGSQIAVISSDDECNRVAVFSGNKWADVGDPECGVFGTSHLYEQSIPNKDLGTEYFHVPLKDRQLGELVKIVPTEDNTSVSYNGQNLGTINTGSFFTIDVPDGNAAYFSADKPVKVFALGKSFSCEILDENSILSPQNIDNYGSPQLVEYWNPEQFQTQLTAYFPQRFAYITYAQLVVRTADTNLTQFNGQNIGDQFEPFPSNPAFSYAQIPIDGGTNVFTNPSGLGGYLYFLGLGGVSYARNFAKNFANSTYQISSDVTFERGDELVVCADQEGTWTVDVSDPTFTEFEWDFGDGSDKKFGQSVQHTYTEFGEYTIEVFAYAEGESCDIIEVHEQDVVAEQITGKLIGAERACPRDELIYEFETEDPLASMIWEIEGGEIIDEPSAGITVVRWGDTNENAFIKGTPIAENGCEGPAETIEVNVNFELNPDAPAGPIEVCFVEGESLLYSVNGVSPNRGFEWFVEGGIIDSGQGESEIEVVWDVNAPVHRISFREFSLTEEFCEGTSPILEVIVSPQPEITISSIANVLCAGDENGIIEINVQGGVEPFTFIWSHDPLLNEAIADNLAPGTYTVQVEDSFGCLSNSLEIEIEDVLPLTIESLETTGVSCFGQEDGELSISISGGNPPYSIDLDGAIFQGENLSFTGLAGGSFEQIITDANGCILPLSFEITSPDPLEVNIEVVQPACPGESNGVLEARLIGGTPPFTYEWVNGSSNTPQLTGIPTGDYLISITDAAGCIGLGQVFLPEESPEARMPTGFNPDEGPYEPVSACPTDFTLSIFNRWGNIIYVGNEGWDGTIDGGNAPAGTYAYQIDLNTVVNNVEVPTVQKGSFLKIK